MVPAWKILVSTGLQHFASQLKGLMSERCSQITSSAFWRTNVRLGKADVLQVLQVGGTQSKADFPWAGLSHSPL